jgi:hypothetical protein
VPQPALSDQDFLATRISARLGADFRAVAEADDRTVSSALRHIIRAYVEAAQNGSDAPGTSNAAPNRRSGVAKARRAVRDDRV